jgi:hypothetical protein
VGDQQGSSPPDRRGEKHQCSPEGNVHSCAKKVTATKMVWQQQGSCTRNEEIPLEGVDHCEVLERRVERVLELRVCMQIHQQLYSIFREFVEREDHETQFG